MRPDRRADRRALEQREQPVAVRVGQPVVVAVEQDQVGYGGQLGQRAPPGRAQRGHDADRVDLVRAGVARRRTPGPSAGSRAPAARGRAAPAAWSRGRPAARCRPRRPRGRRRPRPDRPARRGRPRPSPRSRCGPRAAASARPAGTACRTAGRPASARRADEPARGAVTCRRSAAGTLAKVAFGTPSQPARRDRPDDQHRAADDQVDRHRAVLAGAARVVEPGVAGDLAVVAHHPDLARGHGDVEVLLARRVARVDVRLGDRDAVDRELALGVAADHVVAGQADDPLDQVVVGVVGQQADEGQARRGSRRRACCAGSARSGRASRPGP